MLPSWANDEVTRIRPGTKESRGSTIPDWSQPNVLKISGCSVQPAQTTLSQDGRVLGLTEGYTVFFPPGSDVKAGDKLAGERIIPLAIEKEKMEKARETVFGRAAEGSPRERAFRHPGRRPHGRHAGTGERGQSH